MTTASEEFLVRLRYWLVSGYPDLVQVFAGTVLNITGQAVEVIAITMAVYLAISLVTSLAMNLYGRSVAIVER